MLVRATTSGLPLNHQTRALHHQSAPTSPWDRVDLDGEQSPFLIMPSSLEKPDPTVWTASVVKAQMSDGIRRVYDMLKKLPPAVSIFGTARERALSKNQKSQQRIRQVAAALARRGVPVRSGAGPAAMDAFPRDYKNAHGVIAQERRFQGAGPLHNRTAGSGNPGLDGLVRTGAKVTASLLKDLGYGLVTPLIKGLSPEADRLDFRTQGIRLFLPHEKEKSPFIDQVVEVDHFDPRKRGLLENAWGYWVEEGGYGTFDEMAQTWSLCARGFHKGPIVVSGTDLWGPVLGAIKQGAISDRPGRELISPREWGLLKLTDDVDEIVEHLAHTPEVEAFPEPPEVRCERLVTEVGRVIDVLNDVGPGIKVIGGRRLTAGDRTLAPLREAAARLTTSGDSFHVGGNGQVARAVAAGVKDSDPEGSVAAVLRPEEAMNESIDGLEVKTTVTDPMAHRQFLGTRAEALIALPGGLGTLNEMGSLLCQVQCGKAPDMPIVLVGRDYWEPIFEALWDGMIEKGLIDAEEKHLVRFADTADEIVAALSDRKK